MLYLAESSGRLKHFYEVYGKLNIYTKFHVPRLHSIREKCDANLQKLKVTELS